MSAPAPPPRLLVILAFIAVYFIWGSTYLAVRFGLAGFPPFILVALRYIVAGILMLAYCKIKREAFPPIKLMNLQAISGILMLVGGTGMVAWAEQYITSGQVAVLIAAQPLWFLILDKANWRQYFSEKYIITGLLIGFLGIFLFMKLGHEEASKTSTMNVIAMIGVQIGAMLWVVGSLITKKSKGSSSVIMNSSIQLIAASIFSALVALVAGEYSGYSFTHVPLNAWLGLIFLITFGSLVAYLAYIWLLGHVAPALISTYTYVNPVVAVFLGWALADEKFYSGQFIGLTVILIGILLVNVPGYRKSKVE
ncbi:EamA family transporter [Mucilaginibacter galii]|uniref:Membrane protein n=1 Tax=Mucilaginibacter galii TaxID=2005073 RepID=A0A917J9D6_9SPHI|nr:EamA family transporter [Mucilaginibacter galii]GGI49694.1 membrane protein [Mucilaginibacter galii]